MRLLGRRHGTLFAASHGTVLARQSAGFRSASSRLRLGRNLKPRGGVVRLGATIVEKEARNLLASQVREQMTVRFGRGLERVASVEALPGDRLKITSGSGAFLIVKRKDRVVTF